MNGLFSGFRAAMPPTDALASARGAIDSLPGIMDALGRLPTVLREMPSAPVVVGAVSRMVADAIARELERRGPSTAFSATCADYGLSTAQTSELHSALVSEIRAS